MVFVEKSMCNDIFDFYEDIHMGRKRGVSYKDSACRDKKHRKELEEERCEEDDRNESVVDNESSMKVLLIVEIRIMI